MVHTTADGSMSLAGAALVVVGGQPLIAPDPAQWGLMAASLIFGLFGYLTMVIATRIGEIGAIAPFRYSRLVFAIILGLLVFADTMKELPASLLMRPFDVNTLAIRTYSLAQDGLLVQASVPSLMLIAISLLAVCVIAWQQLGLRLPALTRMQATEQPAWQN